MASVAHTTTRRPSDVRTHLSAYLAGVGVTGALTAGAVVAFLSLAAFVAFKGLPFVGSSDDAGATYLDSSASGPPTAASTALGAARGAVARDAVPAAYRKGGPLWARAGGSAGVKFSGGEGFSRGGSTGGGATGPGEPGAMLPGGTPPGGTPLGDGPPSVPSSPSAPAPPVDAPSVPDPPSLPDRPGGVNPPPVNVPSVPNTPSVPSVPDRPSVGGVVDRVDDAAGTNLSGTTGGVTRVVDGSL